MDLQEALVAVEEGHFVTNVHFDNKQSMHCYNGKYYYEDGAVVTEEFLLSQSFAQGTSWAIKYDRRLVNRAVLEIMHSSSRGYMLSSGSYEECIYGNAG